MLTQVGTIDGARPCPFCGGRQLYMDTLTSDEAEYFFLVCRDCWAEGPMCAVTRPDLQDPGELARAAWNGEVACA